MTQGLFYSPGDPSDFFNDIKTCYALTCVDSEDALRQALFSGEYEFLLVESAAHLELLSFVGMIFALDSEMAIIVSVQSPSQKAGLQIQNVYWLEDHSFKGVNDILSFHLARRRGELQAVYDSHATSSQDFFYLVEHSVLGLVLVDAEGGIFYTNENARLMLNPVPERKRIAQYMTLKRSLHDNMDQAPQADTHFFELVPIQDSDLYVNVVKKDVMEANVVIGSIICFEDVSEKHEQTRRIQEEKEKYERLTGRLNEVLIHDLSSKAYNVFYLKRKLDLEIRHARRTQSVVFLFYFRLMQLEELFSDFSLKREIITQTSRFLLERFPEPFIVGHLRHGQWLVIGQDSHMQVIDDVVTLAGQLQTQVRDILAARGQLIQPQVVGIAETDLKAFASSDELFKKLGVI